MVSRIIDLVENASNNVNRLVSCQIVFNFFLWYTKEYSYVLLISKDCRRINLTILYIVVKINKQRKAKEMSNLVTEYKN